MAEAKKLGFDTVILPEVCKSSVGKVSGINLVICVLDSRCNSLYHEEKLKL